MILSDLVKPEVEYYLRNCNFVNDEKTVFLMRTQGKTLTEIAFKLNLSGDAVARISQKVNKKIHKIDKNGYN